MTELLEELKNNEEVIYAQPNYKISTSTIDTNLWAVQNMGQTVDTSKGVQGIDLNLLDAWNITQGSAEVVVGVIDTGIDLQHESLTSHILTRETEIAANGVDDDGNGYIDDVTGWDFYNNDASVYDVDVLDEHGTHMSGIIANVAPNVKILPLKCFSGNYGYTSDIIDAIAYAEELGVKIVNCSFASTEYNAALADAICNSKMLFVCAAGNYARSTDDLVTFPACYDLDNIISVSAIDNKGQLSPISTYGKYIDVAAPGIGIYSTLPGNTYGFKDGTSCSAAYVSGVASLLLSINMDLTSNKIKTALVESATNPIVLPENTTEGESLLNAENALTYDFTTVNEDGIERTIYVPEDSSANTRDNGYPFTFTALSESSIKVIIEVADPTIMQKVALSKSLESQTSESVYIDEKLASSNEFIIDNLDLDTEYTFEISLADDLKTDAFLGKILINKPEGVVNVNPYEIMKQSYEHTPAIPQTVIYTTLEEKQGIMQTMSSGTHWEIEYNNSIGFADPIYDDYDVNGYISSTSDVDYFAISFSYSGSANFYLGNISSSCNYNMEIRNSSDQCLVGSYNAMGLSESIFNFNVTANTTYYIRIHSAENTFSTSNNYLLRAKWYPRKDSYENNNSFITPTNINPNSDINANINWSQDEDFYKFTINANKIIVIELNSIPSGTNYNIQVFSGPSEENFIKESDTAIANQKYVVLDLSAGTYYIKICSLSGYSSGAYNLNLIARTLSTIGTNNSLYNQTLDSTGYIYYKFTLSTAIGFETVLSNYGTNEPTFWLVILEDGEYKDIAQSTSTPLSTKTITKSLKPGEYIIAVASSAGIPFSILTSSTTTSLSSEITTSDFPTSMVAGEQKSVSITIKNTGATAWTSATGFKLGTTQDSSLFAINEVALFSSNIIEYGQSKTFYMNLTAPNPSSQTTYTTGWQMKQNSSFFGATATQDILVIPSYETLSNGSSKTISGVTEKWYKLDIASGGNYIFRTLKYTTNCDTVLTLYNSAMSIVTQNDDIYDDDSLSRYSKIENNLSVGTYYIKVSAYDGGNVFCTLISDTYSDATINIDSSTNVSNVYEGYYKFTVTTNGTYIITTKKYSNDCDTYLILCNSDGNVIDYNDDFTGLGLYSKIVATLATGTYYLKASNNNYIMKGIDSKTNCTLAIAKQSSTPPAQNIASISITSPTNGSLIKAYNNSSIKITGQLANVGTVSVTVNGSNAQNIKKTGSTFEAYFTPQTSGAYTIKATGTATFGTTNPVSQVNVTIAVNDDGDDFNTATSMNIGTERVSAVDYTGDIDTFEFVPSADGDYEINISGPANIQAILYGKDETSIFLISNNGQNFLSLEANKTYYLKAKAQNMTDVGKYKISIKGTEALMWPALSWEVTLRFGQIDDMNNSVHSGIDIQGAEGTPAFSALNGTVTNIIYNHQHYGTAIFINSVYNGKQVQTRYAHLKSDTINVVVGQIVNSGEMIGEMGSSGNVYIPPTDKATQNNRALLEFEMLISNNGLPCNNDGSNSDKIDPMLYFNRQLFDFDYLSNEFAVSWDSGIQTMAFQQKSYSTNNIQLMGSQEDLYVNNQGISNTQSYLRKLVEKYAYEIAGVQKSALLVNGNGILDWNISSVTVNLNYKSKTYYYNSYTMVDGRIVVNTEDFVEYFDLKKTNSISGTKALYFPIPEGGHFAATAHYVYRETYAVSERNITFTNHSVFSYLTDWSAPDWEHDWPTLTPSYSIEYYNSSGSKVGNTTLKIETGDHLYGADWVGCTPLIGSDKFTVGSIPAKGKVSFVANHNTSLVPFHYWTIELDCQ